MDFWTLRRHVRELNGFLGEHPLVLRVVELVPSGWGLVLRKPDGATGCLEFRLDGENQGVVWKPDWVETPAESLLGRAMTRWLHDARIGAARLLGLDRVVVIPFQQRDRLFGKVSRTALIAEFTGKVANLLLTDEDQEILEQARATANNRPKSTYQAPSSGEAVIDPWKPEVEKLRTVLELPASQWRHDLSWLSPLLCRELAHRKESRPDDPVRCFLELIQELDGSGPLSVYLEGGKIRSISAARLGHLHKVAPGETMTSREFPTVNEALLWVEHEVLEVRRDRQLRERAVGHFAQRLKRLEIAIGEEQTRLVSFDRAEEWRHQGELLLSNAHAIPVRSREAHLTDWKTEQEIVIPLDPEATIAHNARRLFHKYKKSLRGQEEGRRRLKSLEAEAAWVREQIWFCEHAAGPADLRELLPEPGATRNRRLQGKSEGRRDSRERQESKRLPPLLELDGCRFYVGRNGRQNDLITFRIGRKGDLWCHANDVPGAHVVVRRLEGELTDQDSRRGAALAAYFSFARQGGKVRVDVTDVAHVHRIPGGDQGRVYYTHQRTLQVDPLEVEPWLQAAGVRLEQNRAG